jgi:hypothetical protein
MLGLPGFLTSTLCWFKLLLSCGNEFGLQGLLLPKLILSMSISQFEASEKLTGLAFGPTYKKVTFSTLFDHVKDDVTCLNQTEHLLQVANCHAHETFVKTKERGKTKEAQDCSSGGRINSKVFISQDGKQHACLIAPKDWKNMTGQNTPLNEPI